MSRATDPALDVESDPNANPGEIRRGVRMGGHEGKSRMQVAYERVIKTVEPGLKGDPAKLDAYIALFERTFVTDTRTFAIDVQARMNGDQLVLTGHAEFEPMRDALDRFFTYLGFENLDNQVELLPSHALGAEMFAVVSSPGAFAYDAPTEPRENMTQDFLGDVVFLLKPAENNMFLCHTSEGYVGYISGDNLHRMTGQELAAYRAHPLATFTKPAETGSITIPAGARLPLMGGITDKATVLLPGGETVQVDPSMVEIRENDPPRKALDAIAAAKGFLGTKYVWGGKTLEGIDCSGLVQSSFRTVGVNLPRDAYMQSYVGALTGTRWYRELMQPGDLLFFIGSRGTVHHTAIYLGDGEFIEAAGPGTQISSLDPGDPNYSEKRDQTFCFAKRVIE